MLFILLIRIVMLYPHRVTRYWTHIDQVALNLEKAMPEKLADVA